MLGLRPTGVEELPKTLIELGLAERLKAGVAGRVEPPDYDPERDPETGMLNPRAIRDYSIKLADAVGSVLHRGDFPVVLGGDCSILLGNLLALRRRARLRPPLHRRSCRLLPAGGERQRRGRLLRARVRDRTRSRGHSRAGGLQAADTRRGRGRLRPPGCRRGGPLPAASRCPNRCARSIWERCAGSGPRPRLARRLPISSGTSWPASGFISTPTRSTMPSCRPWITVCRTASPGTNWRRSCGWRQPAGRRWAWT